MSEEYTQAEHAFGMSILHSIDLSRFADNVHERSKNDTKLNDEDRRKLFAGAGVTQGASAAMRSLSGKLTELSRLVDQAVGTVIPATDQMSGNEPHFEAMVAMRNALVRYSNDLLAQLDIQIMQPFHTTMELPVPDGCENPDCFGCTIGHRLNVMRSDGFLAYFMLREEGNANPTLREVLEVVPHVSGRGTPEMIEKLAKMARAELSAIEVQSKAVDEYLAWIEHYKGELRKRVREVLTPFSTPVHPDASAAMSKVMVDFFAPALEGAAFV